MKIVISSKQLTSDVIIIEGTTEIGTIKGVWKYGEEPVVGKAYSVELSIENLHKEQIWVEKNMKEPKTYMEGEYVYFIGTCEDIDEVYYIRFALDWLEMIEVDADNIINIGDCILFKQSYDLIDIYPY